MGWIVTAIILCVWIQSEGTLPVEYLIAAGLFAIAGSIGLSKK